MKKINELLIAIDGPSASGKSTTAKKIAQELGLIYIDTGAMYRAVGLSFLNNNVDINKEKDVSKQLDSLNIDIEFCPNGNKIYLNSEDVSDRIRKEDISKMASIVSTDKLVRQNMVKLQREIGKGGGVVLDGRDIGTVVFPQADFKFFMEADVVERAKRRYNELKKKDEKLKLQDVIDELKWRDKNDMERTISPLRKASDAILINTTKLSIDQQVKKIISIIKINE